MAIRLLNVVQDGRWLQVQREVDLPDGTVEVGLHAFPIETMAMRAGEYGIPVTDTETLLDLVLHEPLADFHEDADHAQVPYLVSAPSADEGRAWHLQRLQAVRSEHAGRRPPAAHERAAAPSRVRHRDVRAAIVAASDLDPELARVHGALLDRTLPGAREAHQRHRERQGALQGVQAAANGDGTSTLKAEIVARLNEGPDTTTRGA